MSGTYCVDANVFITAWHVLYPPSVLPSLWNELAKNKEDIVLIKPIYDEIEPISSSDKKKDSAEKREKYPLRMWLHDTGFIETPIDAGVDGESLRLEREYEIHNRSKGANQNDMRLIAYAKINDKTVVTFEGTQNEPPRIRSNYKIPLICSEQEVECITFVEMLKRLKVEI